MKRVLFSVIIPTYNRSMSLANAVQSVLNQAFENWEIIIVDDGSSDSTSEILKPYLLDSSIRYFYKSNEGVSIARNYGAIKAIGEFLLFLDSDDCLLENALDSFVEMIQSTHADVICASTKYSFKDSMYLRRASVGFKSLKGGTISMLAGSFIVRKVKFNQIGGYDIRLLYSENTDLALSLIFNTNSVFYESNVVVLKYDRSLEGGSNCDRNVIKAIELILAKYKKELKGYNKYKANLCRIYSHLIRKEDLVRARSYAIKSIFYNPLNLKSYLHLLRSIG